MNGTMAMVSKLAVSIARVKSAVLGRPRITLRAVMAARSRGWIAYVSSIAWHNTRCGLARVERDSVARKTRAWPRKGRVPSSERRRRTCSAITFDAIDLFCSLLRRALVPNAGGTVRAPSSGGGFGISHASRLMHLRRNLLPPVFAICS